MNAPLRKKLLYAFYGDDFTGSTDVLEVLGIFGMESVLFTRIPSRRTLDAFSHCLAIGIAGESRSQSPAWMSAHLPAAFRALRRLGAPVNHYKVCSTFDSSPQIGNIGRAIELGRAVFGAQSVPIVVGAPRLGRAVVFGNLYATADGEFHRIDRHPTMRRHPVTPMTEADLRLHLARQTSLGIGLVDVTAFASGETEARLQDRVEHQARNEVRAAQAVVFDGFNENMLEETAGLIWNHAADRPMFAVGSSGLTHGLLLHWRSLGLIQTVKPPALAKPAGRLLVLSGSCSPATANQIRGAKKAGFVSLRIEAGQPSNAQREKALAALGRGQSVVLYTALGPLRGGQKAGDLEAGNPEAGKSFGAALGKLLGRVVAESGVRRVLIAGGDTSTHAVKQLGLEALTFSASLAPGVPLCRAFAPGSPFDGLELALKGGQMGSEDFFARVRDGFAG